VKRLCAFQCSDRIVESAVLPRASISAHFCYDHSTTLVAALILNDEQAYWTFLRAAVALACTLLRSLCRQLTLVDRRCRGTRCGGGNNTSIGVCATRLGHAPRRDGDLRKPSLQQSTFRAILLTLA
jgi:hypothetical protein